MRCATSWTRRPPRDRALLKVENLAVEFGPKAAPLRVVDGVGFEIQAGGSLGIVGGSGSGKSMTSLSILRLIPEPPGRRSRRAASCSTASTC